MPSSEQINQLQVIWNSAKAIRLICHRNPDGDALGSMIGMFLLLQQAFPTKTVTMHCKDEPPSMFSFLPHIADITTEPSMEAGDIIVFTDCATAEQTDWHTLYPSLFDGTYLTVNIDHHGSNTNFADVNIVEPHVASACEVVLQILRALEWQCTAPIATALLTGLYTDTGSLLHGNTTASAYKNAAWLMRHGAKHDELIHKAFRTTKMSTLRLWGRVLEKISISQDGAAISAVTTGDFKAAGAEYSELTGAIDYVNSVPGMRFSLLLAERDGKVKGSLRTLRNDVDVSKMAGVFKGGGHTQAAGFAVDGTLQQNTNWQVQPTQKDS